MHPEFITLPGGFTIKSYGFCMMVGFLTAVWFAMRRAERVRANSDIVLDLSFIALVFGVGGARIMYVIHYWQSQFAHVDNKLFAILDIRQGGLEFLGGFLGAAGAIFVYVTFIKKVSARLYMDILAPSTLWGLAFGRLGCYFNGCCFGGACVVGAADGHAHSPNAPDPKPAYAWAVEFPYGSPAFFDQWEDRKVTVPAELIATGPEFIEPTVIPQPILSAPVEKWQGPEAKYLDAKTALADAKKRGAEAEKIAALEAQVEKAKKAATDSALQFQVLRAAQRLPSRENPSRITAVSEIQELAANSTSLPVHPTQLYSSIHAFIMSAVLSAVFYRRKRHGVVVALIFVLYPIPRMLLELIRADNPTDVGGLTISQFVSLSMLALGIASLIALYNYFPERSPHLEEQEARLAAAAA